MKWIDGIIAHIGRAVSLLNIILIAVIILDVVTRYVFSFSKNWILELEWHIFSLIFLLGAAYALQADKHVRVDVFYSRMHPRWQSMINLIGGLIFLLPWCYVVIRTSYKIAYNSWYIRESSPQPGGLPARYVIKGVIVLAFVLLALQGISLIVSEWQKIREKWST